MQKRWVSGVLVVHITLGVSALVCALFLGKRLGYPKEAMPPHSVVLSVIAACLLWVGWFGFNAGSALSAGSLASSAFVATHLSAAMATLGWVGAEWIRRRGILHESMPAKSKPTTGMPEVDKAIGGARIRRPGFGL
jgi:ammonia channel protein AmtB